MKTLISTKWGMTILILMLLTSIILIYNNAVAQEPGVGASGLSIEESAAASADEEVGVASNDDSLGALDLELGGTNEPAIAINPLDSSNIAMASLFSLRVSTDGGATFTSPTSAAVSSGYGLAGDPSLGFDSQGRLFWTYLGRRTDNNNLEVFISQVNPTTGAILAGYPVNVSATAGFPASAGGNDNDKEWLAVDRFPGSPFQDRLYVVWTRFGGGTAVHTTYSTDQGQTWSSALTVSDGSEGFVWPTHNAVAANGDVYVAYHSQPGFSGGAPDGTSGQIFVLRSTDGGATFPQKITAYTAGNADITFNVQTSGRTLNGSASWTQGSAQPWVLPDPTNSNNVYVVAADDPTNSDHGAGFDDMDIFIVRSADQGQTWSAPTQVDDGPAGSTQFFPTAAMDDNTGCLSVMWYDTRTGAVNTNDRFLLDVFLRSSNDGGLSFDSELQLNDTGFDPDLGAPTRFSGPPPTFRIGEYTGLAVADSLVSAVWAGNTDFGQQTIFDTATGCSSGLSITKTDTPDPVIAESGLTYTIVVENNGITDATGVLITDTLDSNVTFDSASDSGIHASGIVTWPAVDIPVGVIITRTLAVTVNNVAHGTILTNVVEATSNEGLSDSHIETTTVIEDEGILVTVCTDQNADGDCDDDEDGPPPDDVEACLLNNADDSETCQSPVPAIFAVAPGSYTAFLNFPGASQGYYPTTSRTTVDLSSGALAEVTLGAVYPFHPKGVAVHEQLNKVYVAFQGPTVISGTEKSSPYPFVAVIDGDTDEVLHTMPGGEEGLVDPSPRSGFSGIGRKPWGVGVSGDGQFVYVGSFGDGLVSIIDPTVDMVMTNYFFGTSFMPTVPSVNPLTKHVHFPDYEQGHLLILGTDPSNLQEAAPFIELPPTAFSPFEVVTADALDGYNFVTLRDAISPGPYRLAALNSTDPFGTEFLPIQLPDGSSGPPHAIGLWQEEGKSEPRIFVTHADDPRENPPDFVNPNKLLVYGFPVEDPKNLLLRNSGIEVGDYAEAGLIHDPVAGVMQGTFGGFAYTNDNGDVAACDNSARGGIYEINFDGGFSTGSNPSIVVGNPPLVSDSLQWKNPFEIAVNPNTGKVYVTDRCWNEFPEGGQSGGGAVLIFETSDGEEPTPTPTPTTTPDSDELSLVMEGPASVAPGETFSVDVIAQNVPDPGSYGVQFEINYDPALISADNLQINSNLSFVIIQDVDNVAGKITLVATQQGNVPGLTGDVTLLTFEATAAGTTGMANFTFEDVTIGNPQAEAFDVTTQSYTVSIEEAVTPTSTPTDTPIPTDIPVSSTDTPTPTNTATSEPDTPTPTPTNTPTPTDTATSEPDTPTPTPTNTPTPTDTATSEPDTPTPTPTNTPTPTDTPIPTDIPVSSTDTPTPTPTPTDTATSEPGTPTPTPTNTSEPSTAAVTGQVILPGRTGNDWSDAVVTIDDTAQSDTTDTTGNFSIADVSTGVHSSITADASGFLSAVCTSPSVTAPETNLLDVTLLSGDVNDDDMVDITDGTAIGASFGDTGPSLTADINRDEVVDVLDIILVGINFGTEGPQEWVCQ